MSPDSLAITPLKRFKTGHHSCDACTETGCRRRPAWLHVRSVAHVCLGACDTRVAGDAATPVEPTATLSLERAPRRAVAAPAAQRRAPVRVWQKTTNVPTKTYTRSLKNYTLFVYDSKFNVILLG